jgi:hypothetical protein
MNTSPVQRCAIKIPQIVRTVLVQADKQRRTGGLPEESFQRQLDRIKNEELAPRGLSLLVRKIAEGHTRFLIKEEKSGKLCEMIESRVAIAA